ncbi:MAG: ribonuclease III [Lachnospirales bacterium]
MPEENIFGYTFKNKKLIHEAFTHSSYANERNINQLFSNERLEFLGDAVLELVISDYLYKNYPNLTEGQLSKYRAVVVCEESFAKMSRQLNLGKYLKLGKGERLNGGNERDSILADLFEASIGAVYLDSDFANVQKIIISLFQGYIKAIESSFEIQDYKTFLQEIIQAKSQVPTTYEIIKEEGPAHKKIFTVNALHNNKIIGTGIGKTKKEAEQNSAKNFLLKNKYIER